MRNYDSIEHFVSKFNRGQYLYKDGKVFNRKGQEVKGSKCRNGKYRALDTTLNGKKVRAYVHIVIFAYFHGIEELKKHEAIDHINRDSHDNRIENLQGLSLFENGFKDCGTTVKPEQVLKVRRLLEEGYKVSEIAIKLNMGYESVRGIKDKKYFNHI